MNVACRVRRRFAGLLIPGLVIAGLSACGGGGSGGSQSPSLAADPADPSTSVAASSPSVPPPAPPPAPDIAPGPPEPVHIDTLLVVSDSTLGLFADPELRARHLINVANDILAQSGVFASLRVAGQMRVSYPDEHSAEQALNDLTYRSHEGFSTVGEQRDAHAADLVLLLRPYANDGRCGYAWLGGSGSEGDLSAAINADFAYAVVAMNCNDYTLLHEVGHLLGLGHSRRESSQGGTFASSVGYGVDNRFATIMASPQVYNAQQLPRLSSPHLSCDGAPCGIAHGQEDAADAVHTLNLTSGQVANYR